MNKQNRNQLAEIVSTLSGLTDAEALLALTNAQIRTTIESAKDGLESLAEGEREKFDNLPEGLQAGEKGAAMEEAADALELAASDLDNALSQVGEDDTKARTEDDLQGIADAVQEAIDNAEAF